ncbi:MAG: fatty acid desaturase [Rhodospirillaceae bacterium]|nr:fatty acid desaturase [Rhodospirillaceae bacterium]
MDEIFGPRDLIDSATLRTRSQRSDRRGLFQLAAHLALLVATGALVLATAGSLWLLLALPLHGIALTFLFAPLHETIHRTALRSRELNDAVAIICGLPLLLPPIWFRHFHFTHHRWTQDPARDPELDPPRPTTTRAWLWHVTGLPYWIASIRGLVTHAIGQVSEPYIVARDKAGVVREARVFLGVYATTILLAAGTGWLEALVLLWIIPAVLTQPLLRLYLLAEHGGCPFGVDMLRNTRTTRSNAIVRFLAWNMPFHAEHHAFPGVPFHALPALHQRLGPHLAVVSAGYGAANLDIFRGLGRP